MKQIFFIALFLLTSCEENQSIENIKDPNVYSIGFGSCLTQERSMPIFNSIKAEDYDFCLLYTSPSPRDEQSSRMPSSA